MLRLWPLLLAGCGFQLAPGSAVVDGPPGDGARDSGVDSSIDGPPGAIDAPPMIDAPPDSFLSPALCQSIDPNLRACYLFENNLQDGSQYANGGAATQTSYVTGHTGQALSAGSSNVNVPNAPSLSLAVMTLKMWIRPGAYPPGVNRMGLIENNTFRLFVLSGGRIRCAINNGTIQVVTTSGVPLNTWSRVACTYDLTRLRVYIDGTEVGSLAGVATLDPATTAMAIGHQEPSGEIFSGLIDEVQVYNAIVAP